MRILLLTFLTFFGFSAAAMAAPRVDHAWLRVVSGQVNGAGYMTIHNPGGKADKLVGVSADCCQAVELHSMRMQGSMMSMQHVSQLNIPAGGTVTFAPMGNHVMFIGFANPPVSGDNVEAVLHFSSGANVTVPFEVTQIGGAVQ